MATPTSFEIPLLSGSALSAQADLLAFTTLGDPTKDGVFKSVDQALGGALSEVAKAESFDGKAGQTLQLYSHGKIAPKRVLVVGGGPRADFSDPHIRDVVATVAQSANRIGA